MEKYKFSFGPTFLLPAFSFCLHHSLLDIRYSFRATTSDHHHTGEMFAERTTTILRPDFPSAFITPCSIFDLPSEHLTAPIITRAK